jgi:hypothetical protein
MIRFRDKSGMTGKEKPQPLELGFPYGGAAEYCPPVRQFN